jgi:hypothetical protein
MDEGCPRVMGCRRARWAALSGGAIARQVGITPRDRPGALLDSRWPAVLSGHELVTRLRFQQQLRACVPAPAMGPDGRHGAACGVVATGYTPGGSPASTNARSR